MAKQHPIYYATLQLYMDQTNNFGYADTYYVYTDINSDIEIISTGDKHMNMFKNYFIFARSFVWRFWR